MQIPQSTGFSYWGCGWGNCWRCSKVHSSKVYNANIPRAVPCNISGVRTPWPGNVTYQDDNEDTTLKMAGYIATTVMTRKHRMKIDLYLGLDM
jgi:hypothetical protein